MKNEAKMKHLQYSFPRLSETNQQYMLGMAVGLKYVQEKIKDLHKAGKGPLGKEEKNTVLLNNAC